MKNRAWISESTRYINDDHYCPDCQAKLSKKRVRELIDPKSEKAKKFDLSFDGNSFFPGTVEISYVLFECANCNRTFTIDEMRNAERASKISSCKVSNKKMLVARFISAIYLYISFMCNNIYVLLIANKEKNDRTFFYIASTIFVVISIGEILRIIKIFPTKGNLNNEKLSQPSSISWYAVTLQLLIVLTLKKWLWTLCFCAVIFLELKIKDCICDFPIKFSHKKQRL